jgi:hypothetical protein
MAILVALLTTSLSSAALAAGPDAPTKIGARKGGVTPQHTITCWGDNSFTKWSATEVGFGSYTQSDFAADWIGAKTVLQKRSGSWPFYSWNDVAGSGWQEEPNTNYTAVSSFVGGLSAGTYRVKGDHYCLHGTLSQWTDYSVEFTMP